MQQVIYADVLVIINMFITYGMLRLTGIICRSEKRQLLLTLAAFLSGFYSLIIIVPDISDLIVAVSRLPVSLFLVGISFRIYNLRHLIRLFVTFFAVNFIFAGLMFAMWYLFAPRGMYFNNGIVYFNINVEQLVILICICYFLTIVMNRFISFKAPVNTLYELEIFLGTKTAHCRAFLDTGNSLKDVFTGYPMIVLDKDTATKLFETDISIDTLKDGVPVFRPVFCHTVSGNEMLLSFRPDKIRVKGVNCDFESDKVHIAITENKIKNGDFSALLCSEIFENKTNEKGDFYSLATYQINTGKAERADKK